MSENVNLNLGRPKNCKNDMMSINWNNLCSNLRTFEEFDVPYNNEYVQYNVGKDEYIRIAIEYLDIDKITKKYNVTYHYKGLMIECQTLLNDNMLDNFINRLLTPSWDFKLKGRIELFSQKTRNTNKDDYNIIYEDDEEDL